MQKFNNVCHALIVFSLLACAASANAAEIAAATDPVAVPSTYNLFTSWFAPQAAMGEDPLLVENENGLAQLPRTAALHASDLVVDALGLLGISYRLGGSSPESGFDCSGMVRYVFQNALGMDLPRRAEEISRVGRKVDRNELKPGDLVFYKTLRRTISHVGIYLGDNRFIHAPSAGGAVRVDDMGQSYWAARFIAARRVAP